MQATQAGIILGTAAYMSPEQAKGTAVDRRADIWAYGTVLYEMLTGERAFKGEDITEVMAHVITQAIEIDRFADKVPKDIRKLIGRCLERNLRRRLSSISEARIILEDHISESVEAAEPEPELTPKTQPLWKRLAPGAVAAVLAIAVIMTLMGVLVRTPQPEPPPLMRIAMVLPSSQQLSGTGRHVIATSPGGTHLVYSANNQLYLRPMDQLEATPINGTEGARSPFFSPDGQWVGFWARGELKKVSIAGGTPMTLCETGNP
jgi:serine/threonine-protein kinase